MKCLSLILLCIIYTTCDATLLTLLKKLESLFPPPKSVPIYYPIPPSPHSANSHPSSHYPANLHPVPVSTQRPIIHAPKYPQHPITYTIVPTGVAGPAVVHSGAIPPEGNKKNAFPLPLESNYNLVHGPGAVLNINTHSKDGWGYALQPIPNSHHSPDNSINHYKTSKHASGGPTSAEYNFVDWDLTASENSFSNAPLYNPHADLHANPHANTHKVSDEVTKAIFTVNEEDATKFKGPIHVGEHDSYATDKNEYHRSYTLEDGTLVTENGRLSTQPDGNIVFVKNGEYQYRRDDGNLVTVRWEADENGFRIVN